MQTMGENFPAVHSGGQDVTAFDDNEMNILSRRLRYPKDPKEGGIGFKLSDNSVKRPGRMLVESSMTTETFLRPCIITGGTRLLGISPLMVVVVRDFGGGEPGLRKVGRVIVWPTGGDQSLPRGEEPLDLVSSLRSFYCRSMTLNLAFHSRSGHLPRGQLVLIRIMQDTRVLDEGQPAVGAKTNIEDDDGHLSVWISKTKSRTERKKQGIEREEVPLCWWC
jgi:hypothetical protein